MSGPVLESPIHHTPGLELAVFADVICPWCYVGKRRMERALAMIGGSARIHVTWLPFELNPDMPREGMERRLYRMRKFGSLEHSQQLDAQLTELGAEAGLGFRYDLMTRTPNTLNAHRLIWLAGQGPDQDAMAEELFRAYFVQGRDIGDLEILTDIAAHNGIDRTQAVTFLQDNEGIAEVRKYEDVARAAGITGVPAFIANRRPLFMGAQSPEIIASALKRVLADAQI